MGVRGGSSLKQVDVNKKTQFDYLSDNQKFGVENKKMVDSPTSITMFFTIFFYVVYYLFISWREKIRNSTPLHVVSMSEMAAIITFFTSCIYLLGFFGITFVEHTPEEEEEEDTPSSTCKSDIVPLEQVIRKEVETVVATEAIVTEDDEEIIQSVVSGKTPSYSLESKLRDCKRAAFIRRVALERITRKSLDFLPLEGLDYESILEKVVQISTLILLPMLWIRSYLMFFCGLLTGVVWGLLVGLIGVFRLSMACNCFVLFPFYPV